MLVSGCSFAAADHERLGDEAFRDGQYAKALAEYQAAQKSGPRSRVWAKAGLAALKAPDLGAAIDAYRELATSDPSRATEAAVGLEHVVDAATRGGDGQAAIVPRAVRALREVAPTRPLGRLAQVSVSGPAVGPAEFASLAPAALATAPNASAVDSLLLRYANAQRTTTACDGAARSYQSVLRRTERSRVRTEAREGLAFCALVLGLDALTTQQADQAERWFEAVLSVESGTPRSWRAQIGRGDARLLRGDAIGASVAYQSVLAGASVPDSLRTMAATRLNELGSASAGPSGGGA